MVKVYVDSREKIPLMFPKVIELCGKQEIIETETVPLDVGDYALDKDTPLAIVERKGSTAELVQNLMTKDRARFIRTLDRAKDKGILTYLLLDFRIQDLWTESKYCKAPNEVVDVLCDLMSRYNLRLLALGCHDMSPVRRKLGELMVRILWSHERERFMKQTLDESLRLIGGSNGSSGSQT